jgi:hypothetical protein
VRLNACGIMDVVQHDTQRTLSELQRVISYNLVNYYWELER